MASSLKFQKSIQSDYGKSILHSCLDIQYVDPSNCAVKFVPQNGPYVWRYGPSRGQYDLTKRQDPISLPLCKYELYLPGQSGLYFKQHIPVYEESLLFPMLDVAIGEAGNKFKCPDDFLFGSYVALVISECFYSRGFNLENLVTTNNDTVLLFAEPEKVGTLFIAQPWTLQKDSAEEKVYTAKLGFVVNGRGCAGVAPPNNKVQ